MPLANAALTAAMAALPSTTVAATTDADDGAVVHVTLRYLNGKIFTPDLLRAALQTQYGAGKLSTRVDSIVNPLGPFEIDIAP